MPMRIYSSGAPVASWSSCQSRFSMPRLYSADRPARMTTVSAAVGAALPAVKPLPGA
jgi:hypothetical protein